MYTEVFVETKQGCGFFFFNPRKHPEGDTASSFRMSRNDDESIEETHQVRSLHDAFRELGNNMLSA